MMTDTDETDYESIQKKDSNFQSKFLKNTRTHEFEDNADNSIRQQRNKMASAFRRTDVAFDSRRPRTKMQG